MSTEPDGFCTIEEALEELRQGRMIVLVDDEYRENEGDLVIAAEKVTPEAINFMVRNGCGILCLAMSAAICDRLGLEPLPGRNVDAQATPWTPHIDARTGITTGTSAFDRARTIQRGHRRALDRRPTSSSARGTCPACGPARAASWSVPATPRAASIWPGWPASRRRPSSARS